MHENSFFSRHANCIKCHILALKSYCMTREAHEYETKPTLSKKHYGIIGKDHPH